MIDIASPKLDPHKLSVKKKIELIKQSDGLLIDLLNKKVGGYLSTTPI